MKKLLYLLFFSIIISFQAISQEKFISLGDEAGIILSSEEKDRINYAVNDALSLLSPEESSKFRVYDFGFYIYDTVKGPSVGEIWEDIMLKVEADSESQYYLVFGRVSTSEKLNESIKIRMKLPFSVRECLKNDERQALEGIIYNAAVQHLSANYTHSIVEALGKLKERFHYGLKCACDYYPPDDSCDKYSDFKYLDEKLRGLGFRKKQVAIGESTSWEEGNLGIYDYFRKKIQFDGDGIWYDIADEVSESKAIFDSPYQELPDTVISTSLNGRVYIHDKNSFINGKWEESIAEANILDYVEYWVVLTDNLGKSFLYSRYTLRGEMPPLAISREGMEIEDRAAYTLSPMGAALKVLGNAAVDAVLQAVIIRIVDPGTNDWVAAWGKVSYLGAAWEGISSLLPWKKDLVSTLVRTATSAFAVVLDNALKVPDYTVQQGLVDFGVGFAASGITQLVMHPKTIERIGLGTVSAKLAFTKGIKRIHVSAPPSLIKVTYAAQKIIIGNGGSIVKMYDKYEARQYAEIFYRTMPVEHYNYLKRNFKLLKSVTNETSTSPNASFSQSYSGVLVKMWVEPGTIDKLKAIGVRGQKDLLPLLQQSFGNLPHSGKAWHPTKVQFKIETNKNITPEVQQVNIQLGSGKGINIFNEGLLYFLKIN